MADIRHGLVFLLVIGAGLWLIVSVLVAGARYEVENADALDNASANYSANFSDFDDNVDTGTGLLETLANTWGDMFGVFPLWMQGILVLMLGALIIWVASTVWTAIGA